MIAVAPGWVKDDSDGDFARDWDLASASSGARLRYYPKLSITVYGTKAGKDVALMADSQTEGGGEILFPPGVTFRVLEVDRSKVKVVDGMMVDPQSAIVYITVKEES